MAALTQAQLDNITNSALNYHFDKGKLHAQHIQDKPLLRELKKRQKTFPGGKGEIEVGVKWTTDTQVEGFQGDDTLSFVSPVPAKRARYPWKMIHAGIQIAVEELLKDGISVVDTNGANTSNHSSRDETVLANILGEKLADMSEGYAAGMNAMLWRDGVQDALEVPGISYLIAEDPTQGIVGGIDRATVIPWRNHALTAAHAVSGGDGAVDVSATSLIRTLQGKVRGLRRYGSPKHLILCGSQFLDALEDEVWNKGTIQVSDFAGQNEMGMGKVSIRGLGTFEYDPTLDDESKAAYAYFIDTRAITLMPIEGEDEKRHTPARPHDKMVVYRSMTWAGGLSARQCNTSMVVEIT